jgi:selenocysteine lyase/cysteine desulfurase
MNPTPTNRTEFLDLPDGRLASDDTGDGTLVLRHEFQPTGVYLDSATYGLPPKVALQALSAVTGAWASGRYEPVSCDQAVAVARSTFARLYGVCAEDVAIGHQVSPMVSLIAASLPPRARVLASEGDFTSLLFPLLVAGCDVRTIPLERLADAVDSRTDLVAVSAVQSADGRLADLDAISSAAATYDALTLLDATQACGWLPLDAARFSVVITGGYKWLCHPRGTAFMTIAPELRDRIVPLAAGWYAGEHPWDSCYGTPLRLASDARRFDVSPAWLSWHAAAATLELFEAVGLGRIHEHNLALANRLRTGLGLEAGDSAIVSLDAADDATERLAGAGVKASVRANRIRLSCHLYNDKEDVDRTLEVLTDSIHADAGSSSGRSRIAHA